MVSEIYSQVVQQKLLHAERETHTHTMRQGINKCQIQGQTQGKGMWVFILLFSLF